MEMQNARGMRRFGGVRKFWESFVFCRDYAVNFRSVRVLWEIKIRSVQTTRDRANQAAQSLKLPHFGTPSFNHNANFHQEDCHTFPIQAHPAIFLCSNILPLASSSTSCLVQKNTPILLPVMSENTDDRRRYQRHTRVTSLALTLLHR